jgi:hypothetical protein
VAEVAATPRVSRPIGGALFWLVLLTAAYFIPRGVQANADSHLAVTYEIVEHATVRIDRYAPYLIDKAAFCTGNRANTVCTHYYGDKAPGISLIAAAVYLPLHVVLPSSMMPANPDGDRFLLRYLLTLLVVTVGCAAFAVAYLRFLAGTVCVGAAMLATLGYAFGTMALPFSMLTFSHAVAAALLFWAFILFQKFKNDTAENRSRLVVAGVLAGVSVACEYPTAIIVLLLGIYLLTVHRSARDACRSAVAYAIGVLAGVSPALIYNVVAFGSPLSQGYTHLTNAYYAHGMSRGILGIGLPTWDAIWGTTFSPYRGLFFLSPWLLLAIPGLKIMAARGLNREAILSLAVVICYFLFQAGYAFWDGGASVGPRHFLPALPFLVYPAAFALTNERLRVVGRAMIGVSIAALALVVSTNPLFGDPHYGYGGQNPFFNQTLRDVQHGTWQNNWGMVLGLPGVWSLVPLALVVALLARRLRRDVAPLPPVGASLGASRRQV